MTDKRIITEGQTRTLQKGLNKPSQPTNLKPSKPPPAPMPPKKK